MAKAAVALNRALSKLGVLSRSRATEAIVSGRVRVDGRLVRNPLAPVDPDRSRILVDGHPTKRRRWQTLLFHKPAGVLTTRRDPQGRSTVYDVVGEAAEGLVAVGRLDLATSGLLLLTNDTQLANWITDPANAVARVYVVIVEGRITVEARDQLTLGVRLDDELLRAVTVKLRKVSSRESHLTLELATGKNREVRRLLAAVGHPVTRLKRVRLGELELGTLSPGQWLELSLRDIRQAFPNWRRHLKTEA